jgi:hypothetical protein
VAHAVDYPSFCNLGYEGCHGTEFGGGGDFLDFCGADSACDRIDCGIEVGRAIAVFEIGEGMGEYEILDLVNAVFGGVYEGAFDVGAERFGAVFCQTMSS